MTSSIGKIFFAAGAVFSSCDKMQTTVFFQDFGLSAPNLSLPIVAPKPPASFASARTAPMPLQQSWTFHSRESTLRPAAAAGSEFCVPTALQGNGIPIAAIVTVTAASGAAAASAATPVPRVPVAPTATASITAAAGAGPSGAGAGW
jgi:hypothetical protein